jgi:hypothetical protein
MHNTNTKTKFQLYFEPCKAWFDEQQSTTCKLYGAPVICDEQLRPAINVVCLIDDNRVTSRNLPNGFLILTANEKTVQALMNKLFSRIWNALVTALPPFHSVPICTAKFRISASPIRPATSPTAINDFVRNMSDHTVDWRHARKGRDYF